MVTIWHAWQDEERAVLAQWASAYTHYTGAEVSLVYVPPADLGARFAEGAASGTGPDAVFGPPEWLGRWALEGLIRPLDALLPEALRRRLLRVSREAAVFNGALYGVPLSGAVLALYYNRDKVPVPPESVVALLREAERAAAGGKTGLLLSSGLQWVVPYLYALGGALMDGQGSPAFNSAAGQAWLMQLAELSRAPGVALGHDGARFAQGEAAMVIDGPWRLDAFLSALGGRLGVAPLPALRGGIPLPWLRTENAYLSAAVSARQTADVLDFLAHVLDTPELAGAVARAGQIPTVEGAVSVESPVGAFVQQAMQGMPFPNRPELEAYWAPVQGAIDAAMMQRGAPEALADALASAEEAVAGRVAEIRANLPETVFPSFAPAASLSARSMAVSSEPIFPFVLQNPVTFTEQRTHPEFGCAWQGIAGEMRSIDGGPLTRIIMVHVRGSGLNTFVVAGTAPAYGAGGWEVFVGEDASPDTYHVTLMHTNGELLSETFRVRFPGNCQGNLARLDFRQVKPL